MMFRFLFLFVSMVRKVYDQKKYFCYLIKSKETPTSIATYIGFTTNPLRRLRQHNGLLKAGAKKTLNHRPWVHIAVVSGFPNNILALQFEWQWQNPLKSRILRNHVINTLGCVKITGSGYLGNKINVMLMMLQATPWKQLNLTINFVDAVEYVKFTKYLKDKGIKGINVTLCLPDEVGKIQEEDKWDGEVLNDPKLNITCGVCKQPVKTSPFNRTSAVTATEVTTATAVTTSIVNNANVVSNTVVVTKNTVVTAASSNTAVRTFPRIYSCVKCNTFCHLTCLAKHSHTHQPAPNSPNIICSFKNNSSSGDTGAGAATSSPNGSKTLKRTNKVGKKAAAAAALAATAAAQTTNNTTNNNLGTNVTALKLFIPTYGVCPTCETAVPWSDVVKRTQDNEFFMLRALEGGGRGKRTKNSAANNANGTKKPRKARASKAPAAASGGATGWVPPVGPAAPSGVSRRNKRVINSSDESDDGDEDGDDDDDDIYFGVGDPQGDDGDDGAEMVFEDGDEEEAAFEQIRRKSNAMNHHSVRHADDFEEDQEEGEAEDNDEADEGEEENEEEGEGNDWEEGREDDDDDDENNTDNNHNEAGNDDDEDSDGTYSTFDTYESRRSGRSMDSITGAADKTTMSSNSRERHNSLDDAFIIDDDDEEYGGGDDGSILGSRLGSSASALFPITQEDSAGSGVVANALDIYDVDDEASSTSAPQRSSGSLRLYSGIGSSNMGAGSTDSVGRSFGAFGGNQSISSNHNNNSSGASSGRKRKSATAIEREVVVWDIASDEDYSNFAGPPVSAINSKNGHTVPSVAATSGGTSNSSGSGAVSSTTGSSGSSGSNSSSAKLLVFDLTQA